MKNKEFKKHELGTTNLFHRRRKTPAPIGRAKQNHYILAPTTYFAEKRKMPVAIRQGLITKTKQNRINKSAAIKPNLPKPI